VVPGTRVRLYNSKGSMLPFFYQSKSMCVVHHHCAFIWKQIFWFLIIVVRRRPYHMILALRMPHTTLSA